MKIEIPEGKKAEWVNGILTLVDESKKYYEFEVGDKAILNEDICFVQVSGDYELVSAGAMVEILKVFNLAYATDNMYKVKHQNSTAMILGRSLDKIEYEFKVGDIAILKNDTGFKQGNGACLISAGAEVEIVSVSDYINNADKLYEVKYQNATTVVKGCDLDKVEFKFNVGDRVTLVDRPLAVFTIVDQIVKGGKLYYAVEGRPNCLSYEESELMLYGNKKVEYKFNVNDKVTFKGDTNIYTITDRFIAGKSCPAYKLDDCENVEEDKIELYVSQDITDRIKTFEDAVVWCVANGKKEMTDVYAFIHNNLSNIEGEIDEEDKDILAYLKLRIITAALNEGWEPTCETYSRYVPYYCNGRHGGLELASSYSGDSSSKLCFKNEDLAKYAAKQFANFYADYCGCKKGNEK